MPALRRPLSYFNPRPSREGRLGYADEAYKAADFNPRPSREGRLLSQ